MMKSALFGAAALALTVTAAAGAESIYSANSVMPGCRNALKLIGSHDNDLIQGFCLGTVAAIAGMGGSIAHSLRRIPEPDSLLGPVLRELLCVDIPSEVTLGQEVRVVVAYTETRPGRMQEDFNTLALEALRTAWPCRARASGAR